MTILEDRYIGDGVYASVEDNYIILDLRGQDNFTRIALEPEVFDALIQYRNDILTKIASLQKVEKEDAPETL